MNKDGMGYFDWYWHQATEQERQLHDRFSEFCDTDFGDMVFSEGSESRSFIECQSQNPDTGELENDCISLPDELEYFSPTWFYTIIKELGDDNEVARYNYETQTISIAPNYVNDDSHLLHEMIHLYEHVINEQPMYFHDTLLMSLYMRLRDKIVGLDEAITQHSHLLVGWSIERSGGVHDVLFLLKSFDLDIKHGYDLGTVFGYGRTDDFKFLTLA